MAGSAVVKPQLRGLLKSQIKNNFIAAISLGILSGILFSQFYCQPRKQKYLEFYKNYDADADFERMKNLGVFDSCGPED